MAETGVDELDDAYLAQWLASAVLRILRAIEGIAVSIIWVMNYTQDEVVENMNE